MFKFVTLYKRLYFYQCEFVDGMDRRRQGVVTGEAELGVSRHRLKNFETFFLILRLLKWKKTQLFYMYLNKKWQKVFQLLVIYLKKRMYSNVKKKLSNQIWIACIIFIIQTKISDFFKKWFNIIVFKIFETLFSCKSFNFH